MTISLQDSASNDLNLTLTIQGNRIAPALNRRTPNPERAPKRGFTSEVIDRVFDVHEANSMAWQTHKASDGIRGFCYPYNMESINDRLRQLLAEDPRSDAAIARAIGVSRATIGDWKKGRTKDFKLENLFAIADELNVSARWLATGKGPMRDPLQTPKISSVIDALSTVSPTTQDAIAEMVMKIAEDQGSYKKAS